MTSVGVLSLVKSPEAGLAIPPGTLSVTLLMNGVGAAVSTTIVLVPAMLEAPVGTVVEIMLFPAKSLGAVVQLKAVTVKSAELSPAATV